MFVCWELGGYIDVSFSNDPTQGADSILHKDTDQVASIRRQLRYGHTGSKGILSSIS